VDVTRGRSLPTIHLTVFLAGFTFLVYEVSWQRLLALALGATVTATTLVLASFMAGLGAGAWVWGRLADRSERPGRLLAGLLAGIGLASALGTVVLVQELGALHAAVAAVALFVPTFLMGGVFPAASRVAVGAHAPIAASLGRLYAFETLGSTLGGLAAGFLLLGAVGQRGTLAVAVAVDLALAGWLLVAWDRRRPVATGELAAPLDEPGDPAGRRRAALLGAFVCGFVSLGLQVLWFRAFRVYFTNTSYTFALVSSLAILGVFVGSALFARRGVRAADRLQSFHRALLWCAVTTALGLVLLVKLPQALLFPFEAALADPLLRVLAIPLLASLLIVVPPLAGAGSASPLACRRAGRGRETLGRDVGLVLMVNTAGAVAGPLVAAFALLPWLGVVRSVLVLIALFAGAAIYVHARGGQPAPARRALAAAAVGVLALAAFAPPVRILPPSFVRFDRQILDYRETVEGTLAVAQDPPAAGGAKYTFVNNSAVIGSSYDAIKVVKMVGHFPFLLGVEARDVLVIGFGIGVTTAAIAAHPEVATIDCVELVTGLADAAVHYRDLNHDVARDPRLHLIAGDGRHHLQRTAKTYDLISCDPTHPILGSGNLYTAEYFALCRRHLNPGGMVSQYLPLHKLGTAEFLGLLRTFQSVFPHCTVWLGQYHAVLLGSLAPLRVEFADWAARTAALGPDPRFYLEPYHLASTLVLDGEAIAALGRASALNTDDRSYTEFFAPHCLDPDNLVRNLRWLNEARIAPDAVFAGVPDPERLARAGRASRLLGEGLAALLSGDRPRGRQLLQQAGLADPDDQELPFLIKLYF